MITDSDFSEGDLVWVVDEFTGQTRTRRRGQRGSRMAVRSSWKTVEGSRHVPRATLRTAGRFFLPAGRHKELIGIIRERVRALGGHEGISVSKLERIADVLG